MHQGSRIGSKSVLSDELLLVAQTSDEPEESESAWPSSDADASDGRGKIGREG